ncbi:hypothetical protein TEA_000286 [Camellia sinensis var. sinensis]|uniref:Myosin motor domain-containing protein n=1 Tax=Camellia sinensis var. sinensis TaxID=542762 RepID=A0A4V3WQT8_CAMSN|nr:hypothetical protein TEA_000286 [Camellia sinensis var. sinensis]
MTFITKRTVVTVVKGSKAKHGCDPPTAAESISRANLWKFGKIPQGNGTPVNIIVGSHVWVEDPVEAWIDGQVVKINAAEAEIEIANGKKIVAKLSKLYPKDTEAPAAGVDDMTKLSYLHEPGVLQNLKTRYELNEIYTYTGNILIAINPFQRLPHIYDAHMMQQYKGTPFGELSPHVFAVADVAYRAMINEKKSNSILVSGESGAGKTETTKMLMRYLAFLGGRKVTEGRTVEQQVLEEIEKYKLGNPKKFHYLNQSSCHELVGVSDAHDYLATRRAMDIVGISQKEQGKDIDSSVPKDDKSKFHLKTTAELLMCDPVALEDALCKRVMVTPEEVIKRSLDPLSAAVSRDGFAKTIYSRLFDWLVDKINVSIGQDPNSKSLIGVLDIYGFESFKHNSFEQFCINFTNEKLQQHFNQHVFKMEQEEYTKEAIDWSYIEFVDNQDVLDLIEKKPGGIVALLDEACMFPKSTHETFSNKLYQTFKSHKRFVKPKLSRTDFTISHYAGEVQYQSDQFLDKNKDYVVAEHQELLSASKCPFVAGLLPPIREENTKSSKFSSIGSRFKLQLQQLMETLNATEPHYIRCVKPNNLLKPAVFENANVMQQLRCGGVLEAIRISCAGYPTRRPFFEFVNRFGLLAPEVLAGNYDEKVACQKILEKKGLKGFQIGKTKVFLRAGQMAELDARRAEVLINAAKAIQRRIRTHSIRKQFLTLREAAIYTQSVWRGRLACKLYESMRRKAAAVRIQKHVRRYQARKAYRRLQVSVLVLQTGLRAMDAHKKFRFRKQTKAATIIQAARETGALKEAKDKLEKHVEELTWRLQLEKRLRTDLEEAKTQEIAKLQNSLQVMQSKIDETNALLVKEREAARKAIEEAPPVIKETQVFVEDTKKVELLTAEVNNLKAPRTSRASLVKGSSRSVATTAAQQALIAHWQGIVKSLGIFLNSLKTNHVPPFLVRKVFTQIFSFINVQLFNSLLLRRECCSFSNGEYVKAGLAELEHWCYNATDEYAGSAWDELKHIRQAIGFLVIHQKPKKTLDEISHYLCPVLSIQQLYRISTMYWDDKYGTHSVSSDVISSMRVLMTEDSNNAVSNSFLLDDDSSIPFSVDDISKSMEQIEISDIEPPALIHENSGFSFLLPRSD